MASEVMALVLRADIDNAAKKSVLAGLAEHANPDGTNTYPGVPRLAVYSGLGESTVRKKLGELREDGLIWIVEEASHHKPTNYSMNLDLLRELKHPVIQELDERRERHPDIGGNSPPAARGQGKNEPSSSEHETSSSRNQTSSSEQGDLQQLEANRPLTLKSNPQEPKEQQHVVAREFEKLGVAPDIAEQIADSRGTPPAAELLKWAKQGERKGHIRNPAAWAVSLWKRHATEPPDWYEPERSAADYVRDPAVQH